MDFKDVLKSLTLDKKTTSDGLVPKWMEYPIPTNGSSAILPMNIFFWGEVHPPFSDTPTYNPCCWYTISHYLPIYGCVFPHFPTNSTCSSMKLRLLMVIIVTIVHHVWIVNPNWNTSKPGNLIGWLTTILITNATVSGQFFYLNTGLPQAKDAAAAKATECDDAKSGREQLELVRYPSRVMPRDSLKMFQHMGYLPIAIFKSGKWW